MFKRECTVRPRSFVPSRTEPPKAKVDVAPDAKGTSKTQPKRTRDVKCFRCQGHGHFASDCPNKRIMTIKIMVIWNLKVTDLIVKACHHWRIVDANLVIKWLRKDTNS